MRYLINIFIFLILIGCNKFSPIISEKTYDFDAQTVSIVKWISNEPKYLDIKYALTLKDFNPNGEEFIFYNGQFNEHENYKYVLITEKSIILDSYGNMTPSIEMLENGTNVKINLQIVNNYFLEVLNLIILE